MDNSQLADFLADMPEYHDTYVRVLNEEKKTSVSSSLNALLKTYTARSLQEREFPEPQSVVEGLIVEGLSILAGAPKVGKSWLALAIALAVAFDGTVLGKVNVTGGAVLYLALEDTARRLKKRISILLADSEQAPAQMYITHSAPRIGEGLAEAIANWLDDHPEARLVVIDTLARVRPPRKRNSDIYSEDSQAAAEIQKVALRYHVAIVLVHHLRKAEDPDPLAMVSGSFGLTGVADAILVLKRGRNTKDAVLSVTGRDIEERELSLSFSDGFWTLLGDAAEVRRSQERQAILQVLRKPPPLTPKEIANILGKNHSAVKKLLWTMARDGELAVQGGRYTLLSNLAESSNPSNQSNSGNPGNRGNPTAESGVTDGLSKPVTQDLHIPPDFSSTGYPVTEVTTEETDREEGEL